MGKNNSQLNSTTQQEETIMSKKADGVVVLQNGTTMSINDYINSTTEKEEPRKLYLGKITNISNLSSGRYFITPCWDTAKGDDNKVAYVSCNKKLPANQIVIGLPVAFSVVEERKHPGKYMALDVQAYQAGTEVITERPDNFPTNISKSRQAYLDSLHQEPVVEEPVAEVVPEYHNEDNLAVEDNGIVKITTTLAALEQQLAAESKKASPKKSPKKKKAAKKVVEEEDEDEYLEDEDSFEYSDASYDDASDVEVKVSTERMSIYTEEELEDLDEEPEEVEDEVDYDEYDEYEDYDVVPQKNHRKEEQ